MSRMPQPKKPTPALFADLAKATGGNVTDMASRLNCNRRTVNRWIEEDSEFAEIMQDTNESFVDLLESNMRRMVTGIPKVKEGKFDGWEIEPNPTLLIFALKTKGKARGWTEREAGSGKGGARRVTIGENGDIVIDYEDDQQPAE